MHQLRRLRNSAQPRLESSHRLVLAGRRGRQVRTRLADVRVAEPSLDRRERHAGFHPSGSRLTPQVVEVEILDLRPLTRELPGRLDGPVALPYGVPEHVEG